MIVYVASVSDCGQHVFGIYGSEAAALAAAVKVFNRMAAWLPGAVPRLVAMGEHTSIMSEEAQVYLRVTPTRVLDE